MDVVDVALHNNILWEEEKSNNSLVVKVKCGEPILTNIVIDWKFVELILCISIIYSYYFCDFINIKSH